jgi:hypothetical protein
VFKAIPGKDSDFDSGISGVVQKVTFKEEVSIKVVKKYKKSANAKTPKQKSMTQPSVSFELSPVERPRLMTCTEQFRLSTDKALVEPQVTEPQVLRPQVTKQSPVIPEPMARVSVYPESVAPIPTKKPRISNVYNGNVYSMCAASPTGSVVQKNITCRIVEEIGDKSKQLDPVTALPSTNVKKRPAESHFRMGSGTPFVFTDPFDVVTTQIDPDLENDLNTSNVVNQQKTRKQHIDTSQESEYYSEDDSNDGEDDNDSSVCEEMQCAGDPEFDDDESHWSPPLPL